jgi:hypothetical protein
VCTDMHRPYLMSSPKCCPRRRPFSIKNVPRHILYPMVSPAKC